MGRPGLVIVGASLAGLRAAEAARRAEYAGPLTLIGDEPHRPYDRPPLSKEFLGDDAAPPFFGAHDDLVERLGLTVHLGTTATALDHTERIVHASGAPVPYEQLIIATGATARRLPFPELDGVITLRTLDDARTLRQHLHRARRVVVVGAGFIGAEIASAARGRGLETTIVEAQTSPLVRSVGSAGGSMLSDLHARYGTRLQCGAQVTGWTGEDRVTGVCLADGAIVEADLVVVGVGAIPATAWLDGSGLILEDGIRCDATLAAHGATGVWAAGDVARWDDPALGCALRLEHWTNAAEQGAHAARNAVAALQGAPAVPYAHVPYFWSDWYGQRVQFAGTATDDLHIVFGSPDDQTCTALYRDGDRLAGVLTLNRRGDVMKYRAQIARGTSWQDALAFAAGRREAAAAGS